MAQGPSGIRTLGETEDWIKWCTRTEKVPGEQRRECGRRGLAAFQAADLWGLMTQGIGLRPQPWAGISRPVGPGWRLGLQASGARARRGFFYSLGRA
jgi:hypothetical protein